MSKKILFTASTMSHIYNFHRPYINAFEDLGYEVKAIALPVSKSFFSLQNIRAIFLTRKILKEEDFDIISSHSTLAGIVTRLAVMLLGRSAKNIRVFHTSHGYLFHDDKSLKKWAYLLPEMLCSHVTDVLMVMNHEDLDIANKYKLGGKKNKVYYIDGMGVDFSKFQPNTATKEQKEAFGICENTFTFVYVAEFSKRKNHSLLLEGFAKFIKDSQCDCKLALAGDGVLLEEMKAFAKELNISDSVLFLGYQQNVQDLYACCDAAVTTSRIEGLPFNVMEAISCGLPVVASNIKGHKELVTHDGIGLLFETENSDQLSSQLKEIYSNTSLRNRCKTSAFNHIQHYSIDHVLPAVMEVYKRHI